MDVMASQVTGVSIVYSIVCSDADKNLKALRHWPLWGKSPVNSTHKGPVTQKMFSFDDVIMEGGITVFLIKYIFLIRDRRKYYSNLGKCFQISICGNPYS